MTDAKDNTTDGKDKRNFEDELNPNDHYDAERGIGKDPNMSGPRSDESALDQVGEDPSSRDSDAS